MSRSYLETLFSLEGRTAVCTGATRGIGRSMATALAQAGYVAKSEVNLCQRDLKSTETRDAIRALGRRCEVIVCDLADSVSVKAVTEKITAPKPDGLEETIDILINCGGIQRRTPAEFFPDQDWDDVLQVNLSTCFILARDIGRHMLACRQAGESSGIRGRGKIINISSLVSFQGGITVPAYAAAKHGILGITKALSNEWASKGINVNSIAPGYISTDMNEALIGDPVRSRQILERIPAGRWGRPQDFEGAAVFLASSASDYVSGETLLVDGGWMGR